MRPRAGALAWTLLPWVVACHAPPGNPSGAVGPARTGNAVAAAHYRVDPERSQVLVSVHRAGPMAALGHDHLISVRELSGEIVLPADPVAAVFALQFPVAALLVDDAALRAGAGPEFQASIDAASVQGTRLHLLGPTQLDATRYPRVRIDAQRVRAEGDHWIVTARLEVRTHTGLADIPVHLESDAGSMVASGEFDLRHADLGLTPYSVALGALRVAEGMHVQYRIIARLDPSAAAGHQQ